MKLQMDMIQATADLIRRECENDSSGHDWWHIRRVWKMAVRLGEAERADLFTVNLGALLHDIADWKFHDGDDSVGPARARKWLETLGVAEDVIQHVILIMKEISFKGAGVPTLMSTREGMCVQDADRLDAIGASGIARAFAYGGFKHRVMHDPDAKPELHASFEDYKKKQSTTINHFYEKLLLLKDRMNTETARGLAAKRHQFMENFLKQFYEEWEGLA